MNIKRLAEQCRASVAMIETHYGKYIRDDGDAPLRALLESKSETPSETFLGEKKMWRQNQWVGMASPTGFEPKTLKKGSDGKRS